MAFVLPPDSRRTLASRFRLFVYFAAFTLIIGPHAFAALRRGPVEHFHPAHHAITQDLFRGHVVQSEPFGANGNNTQIYKVTLHNPDSGRTRDALFKPRVFGDNDGYSRPPIEYVAYVINRMLGMDYVPPVAYRRHIDVNFTHFDEGALLYRVEDAHNLRDVDSYHWNVSRRGFLSDTRILDGLINNSDRHSLNYLRGKHWTDGSYKPVLIDHAAGFKHNAFVMLEHAGAFHGNGIQVIRSQTLAALRDLDFESVKQRCGEFLGDHEIWGMLGRRDGMVAYFERLADERGRDAVILQE